MEPLQKGREMEGRERAAARTPRCGKGAKMGSCKFLWRHGGGEPGNFWAKKRKWRRKKAESAEEDVPPRPRGGLPRRFQ